MNRNAVPPLPAFNKPLDGGEKPSTLSPSQRQQEITLREDYLQAAQQAIPDANILVNVVSRRVKQLKGTHRPLVESLEKLSPEDLALREIIEGKITYELGTE